MASHTQNIENYVDTLTQQSTVNYDDDIAELQAIDRTATKYINMRPQFNALIAKFPQDDENVMGLANELAWLQGVHETVTNDIQVLQSVNESNLNEAKSVFSDLHADMESMQKHLTNMAERLTILKRQHQDQMRTLSTEYLA